MNAEDRSEARLMIQDTLIPWLKASEDREKNIYLALNNIDSHLDKLNGKVAAHEKTILENLPHGIQHCPQADIIGEMHDAIIRKEGENTQKLKTGTRKQATFNNVFTIISTIILFITLVITYILGNKADKRLNTKVDDLGKPVVTNPRGEKVNLPDGYSLKMWPNDFVDSVKKDSIK